MTTATNMALSRVSDVDPMASAGSGIVFDGEKVELLKRTICRGASNDELELFIHACKHTGLDPFMRQIHAVKRRQKNDRNEWVEVLTVQTGIDGYRLIAERTGRYMPGREPTYDYDEQGNLTRATAYVMKLDRMGQWHTVGASAFWSEYVATTRDGGPTSMWRDKPHVMLAKCAEALALRRAFPAELSGVYTTEEMDRSASLVPAPRTAVRRVDSPGTPSTPAAADERPQLPPAEDVPTIRPDDPLADDDEWREALNVAFQSRAFDVPQVDAAIDAVLKKKGVGSVVDLGIDDRNAFVDAVKAGKLDKYKAMPVA